jgi:hypothetical protein
MMLVRDLSAVVKRMETSAPLSATGKSLLAARSGQSTLHSTKGPDPTAPCSSMERTTSSLPRVMSNMQVRIPCMVVVLLFLSSRRASMARTNV